MWLNFNNSAKKSGPKLYLFEDKQMKTLVWPSQSPDLNPIKMLWHDFKMLVHEQKLYKVAELQQFFK